MKQLILGGVRSGKSRLAERLARDSGHEVVYIATARYGSDVELDQRIQQHQERRPQGWHTLEAPYQLGRCMTEQDGPARCLVIECLTLWLTNLLVLEDPARLEEEREALITALANQKAQVILVSNETGLGVVPMGALSRRFVDEAGALHQCLAALCDRVILVAAGLPLCLKGAPL
jgi:adenosylcobinamide kinase/adenosylcobinamide-phosphate guanylyltransferase